MMEVSLTSSGPLLRLHPGYQKPIQRAAVPLINFTDQCPIMMSTCLLIVFAVLVHFSDINLLSTTVSVKTEHCSAFTSAAVEEGLVGITRTGRCHRAELDAGRG